MVTSTPTLKTDLNWIRQTLQTAIELECSTLPPYLAAMFSLQVQNYTVYNALRSVVMEEMVHMATACNMLGALGGTPQIKNLSFPYPVTGLPGGVEPDLSLGLARLSLEQLANFMRLEMPDFLLRQLGRGEDYPTIGDFYLGIRKAIDDNKDAVRAAVKAGGPVNQVQDNIGIDPIGYNAEVDAVDQFNAAIEKIVEQGEGASRETLFSGGGSEDESSHYARFAEIFFGHAYQEPIPARKLTSATLSEFFKGNKISDWKVCNTLAVPTDSYSKILKIDPNGAAVTADLVKFDQAFSSIMETLDTVWNGPSATWWPTLGGGVHAMMDLRILSCYNLIMKHRVPDSAVAQLSQLYPQEFGYLQKYTDLTEPVFYGPRFVNVNAARPGS